MLHTSKFKEIKMLKTSQFLEKFSTFNIKLQYIKKGKSVKILFNIVMSSSCHCQYLAVKVVAKAVS